MGRELVRTGTVADDDAKLGPIDHLFRFAYDEVDVSYGMGQLTTLTYGISGPEGRLDPTLRVSQKALSNSL